MQPDTLIPDESNPQGWNRYSYVGNNPIRNNDPTGHMQENDDDGGTGPTPIIPPVNPPSGGSGGGACNAVCQLNNEINNVVIPIVDPLYDIFGSNSDDGCNSWLLWNGSNFCHHTTYTHQPICIPVSLCSSSEDEWKYALSFQYPGQWPGDPVVGDRELRHVVGGDFIPWKWLQDKGAIRVSIDGNKIINTTETTHIFHQGDITRTVSDGWVTTEGHGKNSSFAVAAMNQYGGPIAFQSWDFLMTSFSTLDKLSDGALFNIVNSIP